MTENTEPDDARQRDSRDAGDGVQVPHSLEAFHGLAAAYALDALDDADRAAVERAIASSPELRDELDRYAESVAHLAELAEPVEPPPGLKPRLMAEIDRTPQLAADAAATTGADAAAEATTAAAPATPATSAPEPPPASTSVAPDQRPGAAEREARRRWFQRPAAIIGAAAAAVVLIAGAIIGIGWSGPNGWGAQREMAAIEAAPDSQSVTHELDGGGAVTLVWSAAEGRSGVVVEGLPDLGADETYELWYIDDSGAAPAGTFDVAGDETWRVLEGDFRPGVAVGVTVEPAGGSPEPTTEPLVVIQT
jgi:anti-sigma-K factor RskA